MCRGTLNHPQNLIKDKGRGKKNNYKASNENIKIS